MTKIVKTVIQQDVTVSIATDRYVNDVIVYGDIISAENVLEHLAKYGLVAKFHEELDSRPVLGLSLNKDREGAMVLREVTLYRLPVK